MTLTPQQVANLSPAGKAQYAKQVATYKHQWAVAHPPSTAQNDAIVLMTSTLKSWGLSTLVADLKRLIIHGDTNADTLSLALSQTDAYKTRFAGNALRVKAGMAELTPAQYLATEEQYRNTLQALSLIHI